MAARKFYNLVQGDRPRPAQSGWAEMVPAQEKRYRVPRRLVNRHTKIYGCK